MKTIQICIITGFVLILTGAGGIPARDPIVFESERLPRHLHSPDSQLTVDFRMQDGGRPAYRIEYLGKPIVLESRLGFEPGFSAGFETAETSSTEYRGEWTHEFGERRIVLDHYRELNVDLKDRSGKALRITFRAYNEGIAFRYSFPVQNEEEFKFSAEQSEFRFPEGTYAYEAHGTEGPYRRVRIGEIQPFCERPLTLEYAHGLFACFTEAGSEVYPRTLLSGLRGVPGALVTALGGPARGGENVPLVDGSVVVSPPFSSTWRLFIVGQKAGDLLERNHLVLNLSRSQAFSDISWIKPGKAMRDVTLSTTGGKAVIDFAARHNLQYVGFDWGWYGTEDLATGDATKVNIDPRRISRIPNHSGLDLPEVIRYAREKSVGVILYVDRRQIKKQRGILFPLYRQWGVSGVKIGFIDVGTQEDSRWILETVQKAAEHWLILDIHDQLRMPGYARTYPNLLTVEGIRGNEQMPPPEHNATLPFTRYIAGAGDYTICYLTSRKQTTFAHQLAMNVISFSPLQWVFWYDTPGELGDEPEFDFFARVPTVWDETKVIHGRIGEYATIARRSGEDWFVGTINNSQARNLRLPLRFLSPGKNYIASIYSDKDNGTTRNRIGIEKRLVTDGTVLDIPLSSAGGQAIWIRSLVLDR